jgi:hypothetical protein
MVLGKIAIVIGSGLHPPLHSPPSALARSLAIPSELPSIQLPDSPPPAASRELAAADSARSPAFLVPKFLLAARAQASSEP